MFGKNNILESTAWDTEKKSIDNDQNMLAIETFMPSGTVILLSQVILYSEFAWLTGMLSWYSWKWIIAICDDICLIHQLLMCIITEAYVASEKKFSSTFNDFDWNNLQFSVVISSKWLQIEWNNK